MGVVIGETADVGDDVLMYMGTVLGGTSLDKVKRHPTIEDNVVIGAGSIILGPITVGQGAKIGAGSVVVRPVPAGATVVGVPGRIAEPQCPTMPTDLNYADLPDPMLRVVSEREEEIREALRDVLDPEVGIDIVDLGLIKDITISEDGKVAVNMVLTSQVCPMVSHLTEQVRRRVEGLQGVREVEVKVLDEPWNWDQFIQRQKARG